MDAVRGDHGTFDDPADYYASPLYRNRPSRLKLWLYRLLVDGINQRVERTRHSAVAGGLMAQTESAASSRTAR